MKPKCPFCGQEDDEEFDGSKYRGIKIRCSKCGKWYGYHLTKGYIEVKQ